MIKKEEIQNIINNHPDSHVQIIKAHHQEIYQFVNDNYQGKKFSEKLFRWLHDGELFGECEKCKKPTRFCSIVVGYTKYCSKKCANASTADVRSKTMTHTTPDLNFWIEKKCEVCNKLFWSFIKRNQRFCSGKCSSLVTANDVGRLSKIRKTKLKKYGSETFVNPEKAKQTCLKKYGVDNASKSKQIIDKIRNSNINRFGTEWFWQSDVAKNKIKKRCLELYGTENPSSSPIIKQKKMETYLHRYGVNNPFQLADVKEKIKKHYLEKYGAEYPTQIKTIKEKISEIVRKNNYKILLNHSDVKLLFGESEYINSTSNNKYKIQCRVCNSIFEDHFDGNGHPRCKKCYPLMCGISFHEKEILSYIKTILNNQLILEKDRSVLSDRELDIYIPDKKIAIEYNGLYWHSESSGGKQKEYHLDKLNRCNERNIQLIHIFEDEWINKSEIVKNKLKHILHCENDKIFARNCKAEEISNKFANIFLEKNHIQGRYISSINIGLFYNNELVAVSCFGSFRVSLGSKSKIGEYELLRYASSQNVVGGCSKLLSHFIKHYQPTKIISYADRRWSKGNLYEKIGFGFVENTDPNYWYFKPGYPIRYHRYSFRKNILHKKLEMFDPALTEWQNMQLNGYDRIWDCGNLKYEYTP